MAAFVAKQMVGNKLSAVKGKTTKLLYSKLSLVFIILFKYQGCILRILVILEKIVF